MDNQDQDNNEKDIFDIDDKMEMLVPEKEEIIKVRNVHKTYLLGVEGVTALRGVTFTVLRGEFIIILGTSGCGKTTLLNLLGSIDLPTKGDVSICGHQIKASTQDKVLASLRLSYLGFVFQTFNLIQSLTAVENVELPMTLKGEKSKSAVRMKALELLSRVGLGDRINHFPNQLSGGEQQRVTIARALANNPSVLLLDEPTGDLDTKNSDLIMQIIVDLNIKDGITIIMVTHDTFLKNFATRTVKMLDGKIAKLEENPVENREAYLQKLRDIVAGYAELRKEENKEHDLGVRSGAVEGSYVSSAKTEMRKPTDYAALSFNLNSAQQIQFGSLQSSPQKEPKAQELKKQKLEPIQPRNDAIQDSNTQQDDINQVAVHQEILIRANHKL